MKSILQSEKECFVTGATGVLHKHHIYPGKNRRVSEDNGFWVYLRPDWHNAADYGVHFNSALDLYLKQSCQVKFEETHSREEFMLLIGRNYLDWGCK